MFSQHFAQLDCIDDTTQSVEYDELFEDSRTYPAHFEEFQGMGWRPETRNEKFRE